MCDALLSQSDDSAELLHVESDNGVDILSDLFIQSPLPSVTGPAYRGKRAEIGSSRKKVERTEEKKKRRARNRNRLIITSENPTLFLVPCYDD